MSDELREMDSRELLDAHEMNQARGIDDMRLYSADHVESRTELFDRLERGRKAEEALREIAQAVNRDDVPAEDLLQTIYEIADRILGAGEETRDE